MMQVCITVSYIIYHISCIYIYIVCIYIYIYIRTHIHAGDQGPAGAEGLALRDRVQLAVRDRRRQVRLLPPGRVLPRHPAPVRPPQAPQRVD